MGRHGSVWSGVGKFWIEISKGGFDPVDWNRVSDEKIETVRISNDCSSGVFGR